MKFYRKKNAEKMDKRPVEIVTNVTSAKKCTKLPSLLQSNEDEAAGSQSAPLEDDCVSFEEVIIDDGEPDALDSGEDADEKELEIPEENVLDEGRCKFCVKVVDHQEHQRLLQRCGEAKMREKIEFVLAVKLDAKNPSFCRRCWQQFEQFYAFKRLCLIALSKLEESSPLRGIQTKKKAAPINATVSSDEDVPVVEDIEKGEYSCERCGKSCLRPGHLAKHKLMCTGRRPMQRLTCPYCPVPFYSTAKLEFHIKLHMGLRPYKCENEGCDKSFFTPNNRKTHYRHCRALILKKEKQRGNADRAEKRREHKLTPKHVCRICGQMFVKKWDLKTHSTEHLNDDVTTQPEKPKVTVMKPRINRTKTPSAAKKSPAPDTECKLDYLCDLCKDNFISEEILTQHRRYCCEQDRTMEKVSMENVTLNPVEQVNRALFESDRKFREKILPTLDRGGIPAKDGLSRLVRLVCRVFERRMREQKIYPSVGEQMLVARKLITMFPQLEETRITPDAPSESYFFWRTGGKGKGVHTGILYNRIRNVAKMLPSEMRIFTRTVTNNDDVAVRAEVIERALRLRDKPASLTEARVICDEMDACKPLYLAMLKEKKSLNEILECFPHFLAFDGLLVHHAFLRLFPMCEGTDIRQVLMKCLKYSSDKFNEVEDDCIKACLRIMTKLPCRGVKRDYGWLPTMSDEQFAFPLIRWIESIDDDQKAVQAYYESLQQQEIPPHITCIAKALQQGTYFLFFNNMLLFQTTDATLALDIFFKCFPVFGVTVPSEIAMLWDFLACTVYRILPCSKRSTVNRLVKSLYEAEGTC